MPSFDVDREPITVFAVNRRYLFKHYFEQDTLFADLRRYYNEDDYRFEVPADAFEDVQERLRDHFFEPTVVEHLDDFCVVQRRDTEHPEVLFKASVLRKSQGEYNVFLMKDHLSVEQAVNGGATRLDDTDVDVSL